MSHFSSAAAAAKETHLEDVFIVSAKRTPVGSFRGCLGSRSAPQLGATAISAAREACPAAPIPTEVIFGNVLSAGVGQAPARQAALLSGLPESTVCTTVNKVCASGMKAIIFGSQSIALGLHASVVAGGMESMSNAPYILEGARAGFGYGHQFVTDAIIKDGLWDARHQIHMGECAEMTAEKYGIGRAAQDEHAMSSYRRAARAASEGSFGNEIAPVAVEAKRGAPPSIISEDEEFKRIDFAKVPHLKPAFRPANGTVTAANASTLNDGASAVMLVSGTALKENRLHPLGRIVAYADAETDPREFTIAPSLAIPLALERAGLRADQIDLFEINEAFSVVVLANIKILGLNPEKVNVRGGGVSLGHAIGSSGCRIVVTLLHALQPGQLGCAAVCNGGGGASAIIVQRL